MARPTPPDRIVVAGTAARCLARRSATPEHNLYTACRRCNRERTSIGR